MNMIASFTLLLNHTMIHFILENFLPLSLNILLYFLEKRLSSGFNDAIVTQITLIEK